MEGVRRWLQALERGLDRLYPPCCVLCGAPGEPPALDLCAGCRQDLPWLSRPCAGCGVPLPAGAVANDLCGDCLQARPCFDRVLAPLHYRFPVDRLITGFKFHRQLATGRVLGALLAEVADSRPEPLPELLLPVPLHPQRLRARGYNQATELARQLTSALPGVRIWHGLRRVRATSTQSGLDRAQRPGNVLGAFAVNGTLPARHVAVVDDVMTTGCTLDEIARVLKAAGVETVEAWATARTPPPPGSR
ncbi:ComF family protein [Alkalispirillum mobile]|uniref:ComF family protein n=1 Tax=Alkalispirillum mobile TaxID=85925 RepID=A0A498C7S4_9GAMM|nr:ComF family protein [Alkalispirillum mobile]RLK48301.1 ComF family protein [Alkalispirillum mobile]